jgi:hypothetical protein
MPATALLAVLVMLLVLAVPLLLWRAIETETEGGEVLDRESAERAARHDAADDPREPGGGRNRW